MFEIRKEKFGNYNYYKIVNEQTGEYIAFIPEKGALLNELVLRHESDTVYPLLQGYPSPETLETLRGYRGCKLSPFPNRIHQGQYQYQDEAYQLHINRPQEQNSIHGFMYEIPFEVSRTLADARSGSLTLMSNYWGNKEGYPFPYRIEITYQLHSSEGFRCTTLIENIGSTSMPIGDGWHPYFTTGSPVDELMLKFEPVSQLEMDDERTQIKEMHAFKDFQKYQAIGDRNFDDCFELDARFPWSELYLFDRQKQLKLKIWQECGKGKYNYIQLYIPADRQSIAIEPMTCPPNAFNHHKGLIELKPDEQIILSWGVALV
jgi:aldose 1-epimerase